MTRMNVARLLAAIALIVTGLGVMPAAVATPGTPAQETATPTVPAPPDARGKVGHGPSAVYADGTAPAPARMRNPGATSSPRQLNRAQTLAATTRFVAPDGNDTGNDCTVEVSPCETIPHAIAEASSGDTIQLSEGTFLGQVEVSKNLTIVGSTTGISTLALPSGLSGDPEVVVINAGVTATLEHLTIEGTNGWDGVEVLKGATATIDHCVIKGAPHDGVHSYGTVHLKNSTVTRAKSRALWATGTSTVEASVVEVVTIATGDEPGGLINVGGHLTVSGTTVTVPPGSDGGAGIYSIGDADIAGSTVSGFGIGVVNVDTKTEGAGGPTYQEGDMQVHGSTISKHVLSGLANLANSHSVEVAGSLIVGTAKRGTTAAECGGGITDAGYNVSADDSCGFDDATSTENATVVTQARPADNGGPTPTLAPTSGQDSVVDVIPEDTVVEMAGEDTDLCGDTDQRGVTRPQAGSCDVGAVELAPTSLAAETSNDSPLEGQSLTLTATVTGAVPSPSLPAPAGRVRFSIETGAAIAGCDARALGAAGTARCTTDELELGDHTVTAAYTASNGYRGSTNEVDLTVALSTGAHTREVDQGTGTDEGTCMDDPCQTIGYAMGQSVDGDSISIGPGTYAESLTIGKDLSLIGSGGETVLARGAVSTVVTIPAGADVKLESVRIVGGMWAVQNHGTLDLGQALVGGSLLYAVANYGTAMVHDTSIVDVLLGAVVNQGGHLTLVHTTVAGSGQGLYNSVFNDARGSLVVAASLLVGNQNAADPPVEANCLMTSEYSGPITDGGHNISDDASCSFTGTSVDSTDPLLEPSTALNNPNPWLAPASDSPAVDAIAGDTTYADATDAEGDLCAGADQRGASRPQVGSCDVGAIELAGTTTSVSSSSSPAEPGTTVTWTAVVTSGAEDVPDPSSGTVTFSDGGTMLCSDVAVDSAGEATCQSGDLAAGAHEIEASYVATSGYQASTSAPFDQLVGSTPQVTMQPADVTVTPGDSATFEVTATGAPSPSIQWERCPPADVPCALPGEWVKIDGATAATLDIVDVATDQDGTLYRAVLSSVLGTARSTSAMLKVRVPAGITEEPVDVSVEAGADATFTVGVRGRPLPTVQWQACTADPCADPDWADVPDAMSTTLTLESVDLAANGTTYRAVVTNSGGTVTSAPAVLSVHPPLQVTTKRLPRATVGEFYRTVLSATGGVDADYVWSLAPRSSLPPGLALTKNGVISGTPRNAGSFTFTVSVNDPVLKKLTLTVSHGTTKPGPTNGPDTPETVPDPPGQTGPDSLPETGFNGVRWFWLGGGLLGAGVLLILRERRRPKA